MVSCPRCAQQVDETTRTTCPHCFTPLSATGAPPVGQAPPGQPSPGAPGQPPQTYAPQLNRGAGTRVSLTGEVIEDSASTPPPSYVGGGAPVRPPVGVAPRPGAPAARGAYAASRSEAPAKSGGGKVVAILLGLLVLGGLGAGGWFFLMPHSNPKQVVQQFDTAVAAQDWKAAYPLIELSADLKAKCPDAASFATYMSGELDKIRAVPMTNAIVDAALKSYQTAKVGEPTIDGDSAKVPVNLKLSVTGMGTTIERPIDLNVPLRKIGGTWKIDGLQKAVPGGIGG